jgi:hypothetical protein
VFIFTQRTRTDYLHKKRRQRVLPPGHPTSSPYGNASIPQASGKKALTGIIVNPFIFDDTLGV